MKLATGVVVNKETRSPNFTNIISYKTHWVIHWWNAPELRPTFEGSVKTLTDPTRGASRTSAHYVIDDTRVWELVPPELMAWHAMQANSFGIGLELDPNGGEETLQNAAALMAYLENSWGRTLSIGKHQDWVATQCPGHYASRLGDLRALRDNYKAGRLSVSKQEALVVTEEDKKIIAQIVRDELRGTPHAEFGGRSLVKTLGEIDKNLWSNLFRTSVLYNLYRIGIPGVTTNGYLGDKLRAKFGYKESVAGPVRKAQHERDERTAFRSKGE